MKARRVTNRQWVAGYPDAARCHCILFDAKGNVTRDRGELRARQEFDKARQALQNGQRRLAAFYAGALAHYVGDLSQFCHVMGKQCHFGAEDQTLHANYEVAVERTINFKNHSSSLLDGFIVKTDVGGTTPEEIARAVALFTERGDNGLNPGSMHQRYALFKTKDKRAARPC